jgi:hypothetical protein
MIGRERNGRVQFTGEVPGKAVRTECLASIPAPRGCYATVEEPSAVRWAGLFQAFGLDFFLLWAVGAVKGRARSRIGRGNEAKKINRIGLRGPIGLSKAEVPGTTKG